MDCDYEGKYVRMLGALEQDYDELQTETEEVASLLQKAKENKLCLKSEIKFLKRRAAMLRSCMRISDPYDSRELLLDGAQYIFGPSRMVPGDFQSRTLNSQPSNPPSRASSNLVSSSNHRDAAGVLKISSKQSANGVPQSKRVGKRKISWQDDFSGRG